MPTAKSGTSAAKSKTPEAVLTKVKRSEIGLGLFAVSGILKGAKIIRYTGKLIRSDDAEKYTGRYLFQIDDKYTIDGKERSNLARYVNHSCRPNAYTEIDRRKIWVIAKRKIRAGEQITIHYGKEYFDFFIKPHGCKCAKCAAKAAKD